MSGANFSRGLISFCMRHGKCQACHASALGVIIEGGAIPSSDWIFVCTRCFADAVIELLPDLSREFIRWRRARSAR